jgi:uncharacterized membrane protein YphA (DoxX/SURF4 family)
MKQCSPLCNKILGGVRIIFGLWMLWAGLSKLFAVTPEMMAWVWSAGHLLGLTFLSVNSWFWIAVVGEIIAWLFLVSWCCKLTKVGAVLTLIIMVFALNMLGWTTPDTLIPWLFVVVSIALLVYGPWARCFCGFPCCKYGANCAGGSCCGGGTCGTDMMKSGAETMKAGAATIGAWAVASATEMVGKAKDMAEKAKDVVENAGDVVKKVWSEAWAKVVDAAKTALDKADAVIEDAKEVVDTVEEKIEDKTA